MTSFYFRTFVSGFFLVFSLFDHTVRLTDVYDNSIRNTVEEPLPPLSARPIDPPYQAIEREKK